MKLFFDFLLLIFYGYLQWLHLSNLKKYWKEADGMQGQRIAFSLYNIYFFLAVVITVVADMGLVVIYLSDMSIRMLFIFCGLTTIATYRGSSFSFFTKEFWRK